MPLFAMPTAPPAQKQTADAPARRRARFHTLEVHDVRPLTDDAVEVTFAVPADLVDEYDYTSGQYVALRTHLDGAEIRRSYSLCRAPQRPADGGDTTLSVGIKRDEGGAFSTWAQTELKPGFSIDVMSPQGTFTSALPAFDDKHVVGIAAGSGITPLMALAHTVLAGSDTARFTLLYTNRATSDVMFLEDLADLKDRYPTRLALHHVLSREQRTAPVLSGRLRPTDARSSRRRRSPGGSTRALFPTGQRSSRAGSPRGPSAGSPGAICVSGSDLQRCGRVLLQGRMGVSQPWPENPLPGRDARNLQELP